MVRVALARVFRDENRRSPSQLVHARLTAINVSESRLIPLE